MNKQTKHWIKPELTILVRNKPEEAVLLACKEVDAVPGSGPGVNAAGCWNNPCIWCLDTPYS